MDVRTILLISVKKLLEGSIRIALSISVFGEDRHSVFGEDRHCNASQDWGCSSVIDRGPVSSRQSLVLRFKEMNESWLLSHEQVVAPI